jgi:hypothetical protein
MSFSRLIVLGSMAASAHADLYAHNPRGSNNRMNEKSANRKNGNRLFDSQNNNRGGYNVGDRTAGAYTENDVTDGGISPFTSGLDKDQYSLTYYEKSKLTLEWTNQHGCGGNEATDPHKLNCNMVIQFACNTGAAQKEPALLLNLKDGRNTNTPNTANNFAESRIATTQNAEGARVAANDAAGRGRHESETWYYECQRRERNQGLFLADQRIRGGQVATKTRQNNNGNRRGLECAEERDYYPYWHPTPFVDVAYLTTNTEDCTGAAGFNVAGNSQNNNQVYRCSYSPGAKETPGNSAANDDTYEDVAKILTKEDCDAYIADPDNAAKAADISWKGYTHGVAAPYCGKADWSRVNHLGNGANNQPVSYNWTLPSVSNTAQDGLGKYADIKAQAGSQVAKCILRFRYNISTDDYDVRQTDASSNKDQRTGRASPVENNPTVDVGANLAGLRLAINTAQFGRTFQDRSHVFYIKTKPAALPAGTIQNLNVRGKRGNIVQTFPSVEYDFMPSRFHVATNELIHVQWTGSNTHNNGNPAGDGQAGDAGEGTSGTDRHNMVPIADLGANYPIALDSGTHDAQNFLKQMTCYNSAGALQAWQDCAVALASGGYFNTIAEAEATPADNDDKLNVLLNNVAASMEGVFLKPNKAGHYHYMCTRNNNFSNRSQKGSIVVV